jgi:hypothetical protein
MIKKSLETALPFQIKNINYWDNDDLRQVATYANPDGRWKRGSLKEAYVKIKNDNKLKEPPFVKNFGPKTGKNPKACDSISLYNFMKLCGMETRFHMSFAQMTFLYTTFTFPRLESTLLSSELSRKIIVGHMMDDKNSSIEENWRKQQVDYNKIPEKAKNSNDAFYMELKKEVDLSLSSCPFLDHMKVETSMFEHVKSTNKYRTMIGSYFNPFIPIDYYSYKKLINLAKESNIVSTDIYEIIYIKLCERSKLSDFHHLRQPEVEESITKILYEDLEEVDPKSIICYGKLSFSAQDLRSKTNKVYCYTISELVHSFRSMGELKEPITGDNLTEENIEKLEHIVNAIYVSSKVQNTTKEDASKLLEVIRFIKARGGSLGKRISNWVETTSRECIPALKELFNASMYMRGWKGVDHPYPIKIAPTLDQNKLDISVCDSIRSYNEKITGINPSPNDLPLFEHDGKKFNMSTDDFDGITIGDRIKIVLEGNYTKKMSSCIRMSSNWLITSTYFYLSLVGEKPDFDIEDLIDVG